LQALGRALERRREILDLLHRAGDCEGLVILCEFPIDPAEQMKSLSGVRNAARLLAAEAMYAARRSESDQAADSCIALCRLVRSMPGENLIAGLVNIAVTHVACDVIQGTLESGLPSPKKMAELIAAVSELQSDAAMARILCGERVYGARLFQSRPGSLARLPKLMARPNYAAYLALFRRAIAASRRPFPESLREMDALVRSYRAKTGFLHAGGLFARQLVPPLSAAFTKWGRAQARLRVLLASLAVKRARQDGRGFPRALDELVPTYLETVPTDPFTGDPLRYKLIEGGCAIYSVGNDGTDDGGTPLTPDGRAYERGTDIVIRMGNRAGGSR